MKSEALKLELIEWLAKLKDKTTLEIIKSVKDSESSDVDWWDSLSEREKKGIKRGIQDSVDGNLLDHQVVKRKYGL